MEEKIRIEAVELIRKNGHHFYKLNIDTKEIIEIIPTHSITAHRIFIDVFPRELYCSALNRKNAIKKFKIQVTEIMRKQNG